MSSLSAAIVACACSVIFGTADWSKDHDGRSFQLGTNIVILRDGSDVAAPQALKKIVGNKSMLCLGAPAMRGKFIGDCFVHGRGINEYRSISAEMHDRGF
jgi:hypothetical protein